MMIRNQTATRETIDVECRFAPSDEGELEGYAAIFGEPNSYGEVVKRGAFRKSLAEHKWAKTSPPMFFSHDPASPIGVWTAIEEDDKGLKVAGRLVLETTKGRETQALLRAGALNGLSIGFRSRADERGPNGVRVLTDIELVEISLVALPAAAKARVTKVRSIGRDVSAAALIEACRKASRALA